MTLARIRAVFASRPVAVAAIVIGNLIPALGVLFLGWNGAQILILYWIENVILGLLNIPRIVAAGRKTPGGAVFLAGFFTVHYGFFCAVHLVFVLILAVAFMGGLETDPFTVLPGTVMQPGFLLAVAAVAVVHVVAQIRDWWLPGKWRDAEPSVEMFSPYGRIIVLHMTILLGSWAMLGLGAPAGAIVLLCVLKTALELGLLGFGTLFPKKSAAA